jgi:hypothetical protein
VRREQVREGEGSRVGRVFSTNLPLVASLKSTKHREEDES